MLCVVHGYWHFGIAVCLRIVLSGYVHDLHKNTQYYNPEDRSVNLQCSKNLKSFIGFVLFHASIGTILLRTLDIITIVVPPALPDAMTAGTLYSQNRLNKFDIYCISLPRIDVCGKVRLVSFDKVCQNQMNMKLLDFSEIFSCVLKCILCVCKYYVHVT